MPEHTRVKPGLRQGWRLARGEARRARLATARLRKGQTLIIFALSFTVLLGVAGLALDVARAYDLYAKMQRAAEAGAIAGVLYMPSYYNVARSPENLSAVSRASAEVVKNGFGSVISTTAPQSAACPTVVGSVEVAVCPVAGEQTDLEVFITERMSVVLLDGLGVQPITLQAKAQAEYIPPVQIGSRENFFGDEVECSSGSSSSTNTTSCAPDASGSHLQYFMATMNGPAELKESGDPYVYCAEGDAQPSSSNSQYNNGVDSTSNSFAYNGYTTNHPQWPNVTVGTANWSGISQYCGRPNPGVSPGNPDYQPDGYTGAATSDSGDPHAGGYNYYIGIDPSVGNATLWIYNPYYIPTNPTTNPLPLDHFIDNGASAPNFYQGPKGEGLDQYRPFDGTHYDAPLFYFYVTYTLYDVSKSLYDRTQDQFKATETFPPYDAMQADLSYHGCKTDGSQVVNPNNSANSYLKSGSADGNCLNVNTPTQPNSLPAACPGNGQWCELMTGCSNASQVNGNQSTNVIVPGTSNCTPYLLKPASDCSSGCAYRLSVEATGITAQGKDSTDPDPRGYVYSSGPQDGWGKYTYALKICQGDPGSAGPVNCANGDGSNGAGGFNNPKVNVYGWNNVDATFAEPLSTNSPNANFPQTSCVTSSANPYACMDLGCLTSAFAGRTLTLRLFDPGGDPNDGNTGDLYLGVVMPYSGAATITYSSNVPSSLMTTLDGDQVVHAEDTTGYRPFNGLWFNVTIQVAPTFQGDCFSTGAKSGKSGWFQLAYIGGTSTTKPNDTLAVEFTLVGSPVHLMRAA